MPRKNRRDGRPQRSRRDQELRALGLQVGEKRRPPIALEGLVIPDGRCYFQNRKGKVRFETREKAEKALRHAQHERRVNGNPYMEKRVYACPEGGCGGFHLSSRETYDER